MANSLPMRLCDFLVEKGFGRGNSICRFDKNDKHYSEAVNEFFSSLVETGEILFWNYNEEDVYEDMYGTYASIAFAWISQSNPKYIDMFTLITEE